MPEISVVMPVYNGEEYLPEAIESVLDQTFGDFEFLVVCEHGSNDASLEIVERYAEKDKRVRPIYNSERLGIAASLNVGLEAATGKYIARMDGDDLSGPRRFEVQKAFLDAYPEVVVCGTTHTVNDSPNWRVDYVADPDMLASQLLFVVAMRHPTIMLRREQEAGCRYDEGLAGVEDYDFYYKLSKVGKLANILDQSLFLYRQTRQNASVRFADRDHFLMKRIEHRIFQEQLGLDFQPHQMDVLHIHNRLLYEAAGPKGYADVTRELETLLDQIWERNEELGVYRPECLTQTLRHRWYREKYKLDMMLQKKIPKDVMDVWSQSKYYSPWF